MQDKLLIDLITEDSSSIATTATAKANKQSVTANQIMTISLDALLLDLLIPQNQSKSVLRIVDPLNSMLVRGVKGVPIVLPIGLLNLDNDVLLSFLKTLSLADNCEPIKLPYVVEYKGKEIELDTKSVTLLTNKIAKPTKLLAKTLLLANKLATIKFGTKPNLALVHLLPSPLNTLKSVK